MKFIPSYTKNSKHVIHRLKCLNTLPPGAQITTWDAVSMYTNIDPKEGIETVEKYLDLYANEYKGHFPKKIIIKLLHLIMTKNVFKFGDTWWQQTVGTAMGTPCACTYATIFFAYFERTHLLPRYTFRVGQG